MHSHYAVNEHHRNTFCSFSMEEASSVVYHVGGMCLSLFVSFHVLFSAVLSVIGFSYMFMLITLRKLET